MAEEQYDRVNCNRCRKRLSPQEATRDTGKSGYVHRKECRVRYQTLTQACQEAEASDPATAAAAKSFDEMVVRETSKSIEERARAMVSSG